jgi:hypothetical protein
MSRSRGPDCKTDADRRQRRKVRRALAPFVDALVDASERNEPFDGVWKRGLLLVEETLGSTHARRLDASRDAWQALYEQHTEAG